MAPRIKHTVAGADALRAKVLALKKPQPSVVTSRMGVTTFIKTVLRNNVKFSPRRGKSSGTRGGTALSRGRTAHRLVEAFCKTGKLPPKWRTDNVGKWVRGISDAMYRSGIEPLRCELGCYLGALKTNVDLLGMVVGKQSGKPELVCVEFKTTSHTHKQHVDDYDSVCQRRSVMGAGLGLPNTEREAHRIQCAFGSEALKKTYTDLVDVPVSGCVILASTTSTACYTVKPIPASRFEFAARMSSVCAKKAADRLKLTEGRLFPPLPPIKGGGAAVRAALAKAGHTKIRKSMRASCLTQFAGKEFVVGIVEGWNGFAPSHRQSVVAELAEIAGGSKHAALLIFDLRKSLWRLQYV